ncbi:MAG: hypothetical protein IPJ56_13115 [Gemmatimonadetes bacterium]|nr:hypothetical protein [Gemmatimonadota bacterium]
MVTLLVAAIPRLITSTESPGSTSRSASRSRRENVPLRGYGNPAVVDSPSTNSRKPFSGLRLAKNSGGGAGAFSVSGK